MMITDREREERRRTITALMARWAKSNDTKEKARLVMVKNQQVKIRRPNSLLPG
jgi:hypothetical protein